MAASTYFAQVQQLYIAYFGRPADTVGLAYWAAQIDAANGSIAAVQAGFSASTESQALFGNKSTIDKVTAIYQNAFNRAPEPAGLAYWVAQLDSGKVTQAQASWTIQQSAGAGDAAAVQNKLTAAQAFTAQIDTTAEIQGYQGTAAADAGRAFLQTVNSNNATATTAVNGAAAALNTAVAASANASGKPFALTTGVDNLVGTTGNDVFSAILVNNELAAAAATSTLNAFDLVDGGAGTLDKLAITVTGGNSKAALAATLPVTTGVEVLSIKNLSSGSASGVTIDASTATGLTQVVNDGSTGAVAVTGVANAAVVAQNTVAGTTVTFKDGTFSAASTVANVAVNNAGTAATGSAVAVAAAVALNDGDTVAATGIAIKADGVNVVKLSGTALGEVTTATVTGTGSLDIALTSAPVTKVDASALLGGLTYTTSATAATTILTGAGNDVISIGANLATASNITLGAGNDAIKKGGAFTVATGSVIDGGAGVDNFDLSLVNVSNASSFVNFEVASLDGLAGVTYDLDLLSAKNTLTGLSVTAGGTASATVSNVASGANLAVNGGTTSGLTLVEKGAITSATDSLNITFGATTAAASSLSATVNEVETFNIVSGGVTGATNTLTLAGGSFTQATVAAPVTEKFVVTGANALVLGVTSTSANTKISIDGSAATGKLTVNADAHTTIITTGAGDDVIEVAAVATSVVTGAGKDVVNVLAAAGATNITTVTGLTVGDSLTTTVTGGGAAGTGTVAKIGAATALGGATDLTTVLTTLATAADTATSHSAWAVVGSDVYLVLDTNTSSVTGADALAADNVIKLAGVTDISNYTSNGNGLIAVA